MRLLTADYLLTPDGLRAGMGLIISESGKIQTLLDPRSVPEMQAERFSGILMPGLVNAHCHLELSHMKGVIPRGTGLGAFGLNVVKHRGEFSEAEIVAAASQQAKALEENGTVALGDISNLSLTAEIKSKSALYFRTFIELISFHPQPAAFTLERGMQMLPVFEKGERMRASLAPHAPYSVSQELFGAIGGFETAHSRFTSLHMLESPDEVEFLAKGRGPFATLYKTLGLDLDFFEPKGEDSVTWCEPLFFPGLIVQLVHNTLMQESQLQRILLLHKDTAFCLCPRANLYIESRLPDVEMFRRNGAFLTLGTDSLASNDDLNLLNEIRILQRHFPSIPLEEMLIWATRNGARALGFEKALGSFEPGMSPGIYLLKNVDLKNMKLTEHTVAERL